MSKPKFDFYEVVKVISKDKNKIFGNEAVVLAKGQNDQGEWGYTISVQDDCAWDVEEHQIESLGRFKKKEDLFTGKSVKVHVNEDGEGYLKEED